MIIVIAKIFLKDDKLIEGKDIIKKLVIKTNVEEGCLEYNAYQNSDDVTEITFIEKWASPKNLEAHVKAPHFIELIEKLSEISTKPLSVNKYTTLE